jgi:predicted porin
MKKTLLATAILAGLVSASAQAATVYDQDGTSLEIGGRIEARAGFLNVTDSTTGEDVTATDKSRSRVGISGSTQISENVTGFAFTELEFTPSAANETNYLYAGVATSFGDFSFGQQDTANVQVSDMTDILSYDSGLHNGLTTGASTQPTSFLYSVTIDALTIKADYVATDEEDGDAFGASALYSFDFGLDLGLEYTAGDEDNEMTMAAAYSIGNLYLAASYAMGDIDETTDFTSLEASVQYKLTKELRLLATLGQQEQNDADTEDYYAVEAQYRFNEALRTVVSYKVDNITGNDNTLVAGIRYNF